MNSDKVSEGSKKYAFEDSLSQTLKVGLASGGAGFLLGGTAGILKNTTPVLFGVASSVQCAALGTTFWLSRAEILRALDQQDPAPSSLTQASALAGGVSGGLSALVFRGPRNVLPGVICISLLGAGGQHVYNHFTRKPALREPKPGFWQSIANAKWSPLQPITDEDYIERLREQQLRYRAEIAILDDKITALKRESSTARVEQDEQDRK